MFLYRGVNRRKQCQKIYSFGRKALIVTCISFTILSLPQCQSIGPKVIEPMQSIASKRARSKVLVSYSYFEKDDGQRDNFEFFILEGMKVQSDLMSMPKGTDFSIVVNGDKCTPCSLLSPFLRKCQHSQDGVAAAWAASRLTLLHRIENFGMDIAAHNVTLELLHMSNKQSAYEYFIFLNSSVRGPFFPTYMPRSWQWTDAFVSRLVGDVKIVASSIACLPSVDPGGYGPKAESWAFALDSQSLALLVEKGIFWTRTCKVCHGDEGIVVASEYGMSKAILAAGYNLATHMSRYAKDTDWRDPVNWNCNDNVHPSRHGTYDGISMHPFETLFVKESWHVGEPHLSRYTRWKKEHHLGKPGTQGLFDRALYDYALCNEGRSPEGTQVLYVPKKLTCTGSDQ